MASMVRRAAEVCADRGVTIRFGRSPVLEVRPDGGIDVDGDRFDGVVLATPPKVTADLVSGQLVVGSRMERLTKGAVVEVGGAAGAVVGARLPRESRKNR